jgi:DNA-binding transcriptional regulator of glucitol operon
VRKLLTPKWLALHALTVFLVLSFCFLAIWQFKRGESGNARSWGYAFQWPAFAIFVVYMWIRMMREELHPVEDEPRANASAAGAVGDSAEPLPEGVATAAVYDDEDDDPELDAQLAEYNRYLADLHERASRSGGR